MPPFNTMTADQPNFLSHLRTQRLTEELAVAQKKVREYEDLFVALYRDACEHCQESFQRICVAGTTSPVPESNQAAVAEATSSVSNANGSPHVPSSSSKPFWHRILKRPTQASFSSRDAPTTSPLSAPEAGASQHSRRGMLLNKQIRTFKPKVSISPPEDKSTYLVKISDCAVGMPRFQVQLERTWPHRSSIYSVKFSPDGKCLAVGIADGGVDSQRTYIYDVTSGRKICLLADRYTTGKHFLANYLAFSPGDGRYLATGHTTGQTMIWDVGTKRVRSAFGNYPSWENSCVEFSPDGRFVASISLYRSSVRIWSMRDGSSIYLRGDRGAPIGTVAVKFSPDGKHVVASDFHGVLRLWNVRTSKLVGKWIAHQHRALFLAFTENGTGLVTGSQDETLKYWDISQLGFGEVRCLQFSKFGGHTKAVSSVSMSPDGRWVISGSHDGTACIWDTADSSPQCTLLGHENGVSSVDISPTGNCVACGGHDGSVSLWRCGSSGE